MKVPMPRRGKATPNARAMQRANPRASFKRGSMPMPPATRVAGRNRDRNIPTTAKVRPPIPTQRPTGVQPYGKAQPKGNLNPGAAARAVSSELGRTGAYISRGVSGIGKAVGDQMGKVTGGSRNLDPGFDPNNPLKQILKR